MAVLVFQNDPWTSGPPDAIAYGDPSWFRSGPNGDLFGPLAWTTNAERGFDWTDLEFFTKSIAMLRLTALDDSGFAADLRLYGDEASTVTVTGQDFGYLWPWPGATVGQNLTGGTVTGFSGTIQSRGGFAVTGLSVPVEALQALASRSDAGALLDANDLLLAGDDLIIGSGRNDALRGGPGGDTVRGGAGADVLDGQNGDDVLVGGTGNDRLAGGAGFDVAETAALRHQARLHASGGTVELGGPEGHDTLTGIEAVRFADGTLHFDAAGAAGQVSRLYAAALGRAPDPVGFGQWTAMLEAGATTPEDMAAAFAASAEFRARCGALDDADFAAALYRDALGRAPDEAGLRHWVDRLRSGELSQAEALAGFSGSEEGVERSRAGFAEGVWTVDPLAAEVVHLYGAALHRLPDAAGLSSWLEARAAGLTTRDMADGFAGSAEFQQRFGGLGNRDFVAKLYQAALDRPADAAGLDAWTESLDSGALKRGQVVLGFAFSEEMTQKIAPALADGVLFA